MELVFTLWLVAKEAANHEEKQKNHFEKSLME
jgi:hypothetical protein